MYRRSVGESTVSVVAPPAPPDGAREGLSEEALADGLEARPERVMTVPGVVTLVTGAGSVSDGLSSN
jgi:hypothetical protein